MRRIIFGHLLLTFSKYLLGRQIVLFGARPSHAEWQGKVYSRSGTSKKYPSLEEATGYGTVTGLCGANCRHTMTPYVEGYSQLPNTDYSMQEKRFGMASDEYYAATQKQRRLEREIRKVKRERAAIAVDGQETVKQDRRIRELQKKLREHVKENHLTRDYQREKVWGIFSYSSAAPTTKTTKQMLEIARKHKPNVVLDGREIILVDKNGFPITNKKIIDEFSKKRLVLNVGKQRQHVSHPSESQTKSTVYMSEDEIRNLVEKSDAPLVFYIRSANDVIQFEGRITTEAPLGIMREIDPVTNEVVSETVTNNAIVHISKKGYHVVPSRQIVY